MDEDEQKEVLEQVFGQSSESEEDDEPIVHGDQVRDSLCESESLRWEWEPIQQVKGLWLCTRFLSPRQQSRLLAAIQAERWFSEPSKNQAMRFGDLPPWATQLSDSIRESALLLTSDDDEEEEEEFPLPLRLLWREPLFDQLIANVYEPGEGICAHVDLLRFEDGIAIVSLESSCVMHFTPTIAEEDPSKSKSGSVPVLLTPGSLVLMSGEARYHWKHEINRRPGFQIWQGQELNQMRRTSITLRKLCSSE